MWVDGAGVGRSESSRKSQNTFGDRESGQSHVTTFVCTNMYVHVGVRVESVSYGGVPEVGTGTGGAIGDYRESQQDPPNGRGLSGSTGFNRRDRPRSPRSRGGPQTPNHRCPRIGDVSGSRGGGTGSGRARLSAHTQGHVSATTRDGFPVFG